MPGKPQYQVHPGSCQRLRAEGYLLTMTARLGSGLQTQARAGPPAAPDQSGHRARADPGKARMGEKDEDSPWDGGFLPQFTGCRRLWGL